MTNIYDASESELWERERERQERETLALKARANLAEAPWNQAPDAAAARARNTRFLGQPAPADAPDLSEMQRGGFILENSPRLQEWWSKDENAAIAHDDLVSLSFWERLAGVLGNPSAPGVPADLDARAFRDSSLGQSIRRSGFGQAMLQGERSIELARLANRDNPLTMRTYDDAGPLSPEERARMLALRANTYDTKDWVEDVGQQIPIILGSFDAGARRAIRDMRSSWREVYGSEPRPLDLKEGVLSTLLFPVAGVSSAISGLGGAVRGVTGFVYEQEAGTAFEEYRQYVDESGNQLDPLIAGAAARDVGMINAAIEFVGLAGAAKAVGISEIVERITRAGVRDALRRRGFASITRRLATGIGGAAATEGFTELTQEGVTIALGQLAQQQQGGEWEDLDDEQVAARLWEAFSVGATVGGVFGAAPGGVRFAQDIEEMRDARTQLEVFDAIAEGSLSSRTRERAPQTYMDAVETLTKNGPLEEARIDAERFVAFFQDLDQDPYAAADRLAGVGREALQDAIDSGGDLTIPMKTYATQIAGTEAHNGLAQHVRMGPGRMTPAEVRARLELGVDLERAIGEATRIDTENRTLQQKEEAVYNRVVAQFEGADSYVSQANEAFARVIARGIVRQAMAAGVEPEALLDRIGLDITGVFGGKAETDEGFALFENDAGQSSAVTSPRAIFDVDEGFGAYQVIRNPSDADLRRLLAGTQRNGVQGAQRQLRYIVDDNGALYAFDANLSTHGNARADLAGRGEPFQLLGKSERQRQGIEQGFIEPGKDGSLGFRENTGRYEDETLRPLAELRPPALPDGSAFDQTQLHPTALRFGSESEAQDLIELIQFGADAETILAHPIMQRIERHTLAATQTMDPSVVGDVNALNDREFVIDGEPASYEEMLADALAISYSFADVAQERKATIVIGNPGAGKSTFVNLIAKDTRSAVIDADQIKGYIPEFESGYNTYATLNESSFIRWRVRDAIVEVGDNLILEALGDSPRTLLKAKADLEARGYTVEIAHIKVDADETVRRATRRFLSIGRYIDPPFIRRVVIPKIVEGTFDQLVANGDLQAYVEIDATPPQNEATITRQENAERTARATSPGLVGGLDRGLHARAGALRAGARDGFNQDEVEPPFYSAVERAIEAQKTERAPGAQWWATISKLPGVKREELEWIGLEDWLKAQRGQIERADVLAFVKANGVRVEETVLGETATDTAEIQRQLLPLIEERERINRELGTGRTGAHRLYTLAHELGLPSQNRADLTDAQWAQLNEAYDAHPDTISAAQKIARLNQIVDEIQPLETQLRAAESGTSTRWSRYTLPGGENYRELLLRLPERDTITRERTTNPAGWGGGPDGTEGFIERGNTGADFRSSHFDQPNVLAHVRFKERTDANGARTLFIEELQSDWHQGGRERGYKTPLSPENRAIIQQAVDESPRFNSVEELVTAYRSGYLSNFRSEELRAALDQAVNVDRGVPDAPFKNNAWASLALKRMIRWAAENNFEQIAWTRGQHQNERFSLEKHLSRIYYDVPSETLTALDKGGGTAFNEVVSLEELDQYIGKETADKVREEAETRKHEVDEWIIEPDAEEMALVLFDSNGEPVYEYGGERVKFGDKDAAEGWIYQQVHEQPITLEGLDLKVGGEGMRAFYDKIMVNIANDLGKKFGARVGEAQIYPTPDDPVGAERIFGKRPDTTTVHSLQIYPAMREQALAGLPLFQGQRGQVVFNRDNQGFIRQSMVRFFESRNLSTALHEVGGHVFLETLRIVAAEQTSSPQAKADWQTVLDWFGVTDEQWSEWSMLPNAEAVAKLRPYHERFARGFELYVMEGKAPSLDLRAVFSMFKRWMLSIYKSLTDLNVDLTPEIRSVYDRLLATQEEIDEANAAMGAEAPMSREEFGAVGNKFADASYQRYLRGIDRARAEAEAEIERRAVSVLMADQTRWWRSEEAKTREAVKLDLKARPEWIAHDWLSGTRMPENMEPIRLSPSLTLEEYGEDLINRLPGGIIMVDVAGLTAQARQARRILSAPAPKRMVERIAELGGIKDPDGEVAHIVGTDSAVPVRGKMKRRLIDNDGGRSAEDLILTLWEEGYLGAKPGSHGFMQLAGINAGTANMELLAIAKEMEAKGSSPGLIWQLTGWARSRLHKEWQFEINPDGAKPLKNFARMGRERQILPLPEVLDWPELYGAYPFLEDITVHFENTNGRGGGSFLRTAHDGKGAIFIGHKRGIGSSENALSVLRHEIQHAIQRFQGWPQGYNPNDVRATSPRWKRAYESALAGAAYWRKVVRGESAPTLEDIKAAEEYAALEVYLSEKGEIEARLVEARARANAATRKANPPGSDIDQSYINESWTAPREPYQSGFLQDDEEAAGFYANDGPERPSIQEFLDALAADLRGEHVYSTDRIEEIEARENAQRIVDWFAEHGVAMDGKAADVAAQIEALSRQLDQLGMDADSAASLVNGVVGSRAFDSGKAMLNALADLPTFAEAVKAETKRRMHQAYGDPFADGTIAEAARQAAHNSAQEQRLEMELDAISRATGGRARPVSAAAKSLAERQIARMSVKQIRKYEWFLGNERRHAKQAQEALRRGDNGAAKKAKYNQLVNFHLYKLARDASEEMDKAQRYFRRLQTLGHRAKIEPGYYEQIEQLLDQYEIRKISGAEQRRRMALAAWARSMDDRGLGHLVTIDPRILENASKRPFDQLDLDEARALVDAVRNIEHLGRLKDRLLEAADQRAFDTIVSDLVTQMEATGPVSKDVRGNYSPTAFERTSDKMRTAHAEMTRMEFLFRYLDGGHSGALWRALWLPFARAADKESLMMHGAAKRMNEIWRTYSRAERARLFKTRYEMRALPIKGPRGTASSFTRSELIAVALNLGNSGNVEALVDGFGWFAAPLGVETDYIVAKQKIIAELDTVLTQRDWQTVQAIWDLVGSFRDEAFQLQQDLTGLRPEAVQADGVTTRYGDFAGGYYPLKFDRTRDLRVDKVEKKEEVQSLYGANWTAPMTKKGHLINRVGSGGRPVKLNLTVFTEHVQNVVHDVAYRRAVIDVNRLISDQRFGEEFVRVAGQPMYDQLAPWLQAIAADRIDPSAFMWKALQKLRGNVAIAAMGYRISTAMAQLTGILQAVPVLGGPEIAVGLTKLMARPDLLAEKAKIILNRSEFMRSRVQTFDRDVRETIDQMQRDDVLYPIRKNAFMLVGMFDWAVSSVVWTTAYDKARAGKMANIDPNDEQAAVHFADSIVRQTQSAGLQQDLPAIMRGNQVNKLLTMFFSYFSVLYNWSAYDQVLGVRKGRLPPHVFIGNMALIYIVAPLIAEALAGRWEPRDDEDDDERNARLLAVLARYPFQTIPFVRDLASAFGSYFEYQLSPAQSGPAQIIEALEDAAEGKTFESEATTKRAVTAIGYAYGLPTPQAWVTADWVADKIEGEEEGFDPFEMFVRDSR